MTQKSVMLARVKRAIDMGQLPPGALKRAREQLEAAEVINSQKAVLNPPYYSRIRFESTYAAGPPVVLTWPAGQTALAFSYAQGDDMAPAGDPGVVATPADTNLSQSRETNDGQIVEILGIQVQPCRIPDALIVEILTGFMSVALRFGAKRWQELGLCSEIPGGSGGNGGQTAVLEPMSRATTGDRYHQSIRHGNLAYGNVMRFPEAILWTPDGANQRFDIEFRVEGTVEHTCPLARVAATSGAGAGNDILAYDPPAGVDDRGGHLDLMVKLLTRTIGPRSVNE